MIDTIRIKYLCDLSRDLFLKYIALEEAEGGNSDFFNKYSIEDVVLIPENIDVRHDLKGEAWKYILRNTIELKSNLEIPIGRFDVHFDIEYIVIDEIFDLYEGLSLW